MDFQAISTDCDNPFIGAAVLSCLEQLFKHDVQLLELDAKEEAIAAHFASYLKPHLPELHVDCEYNLMGDAPKAVTYDENPQRVFPDIIVHRRHTDVNILAIEIKKDTNREPDERDISKLRAYRRELRYRYALFLRLGTRNAAGTVVHYEWVSE